MADDDAHKDAATRQLDAGVIFLSFWERRVALETPFPDQCPEAAQRAAQPMSSG